MTFGYFLRLLPSFVLLAFALLFSSCTSVEGKLSQAEAEFDAGKFESAQYKYFELISTTDGEERTKIADSYMSRVSALISQLSFDAKRYPEWAAVFDTMPDYKTRLDSVFSANLIARAKAYLNEGKIEDGAVLAGYIPESHTDGELLAEIANAQKERENAAFEAGREHYLNKEYDAAIEEWSKLDPSSELGKRAEEIKDRIPKEKLDHYLAQARKRPVEGFRMTASGPISRIIYNRVEPTNFEMESAQEGRQFLRIEATITEDIDLYAWYIENGEFVNVARMQREITEMEIENPEDIKRVYKRNIVSGRPAKVVYFVNTEFDYYRTKKIYVSTGFTPRVPEDLEKISVVHAF